MIRLSVPWFVFLLCPLLRAQSAIPSEPVVVPDGIGVNIHFTDPQPGEMKMIADAGFKWVRMDFAWNGTEREKGVYDFGQYDGLLRHWTNTPSGRSSFSITPTGSLMTISLRIRRKRWRRLPGGPPPR